MKLGDCSESPVLLSEYEPQENASWIWGAKDIEYPGYIEDVDPSDTYKPGAGIYNGLFVPGSKQSFSSGYFISFDPEWEYCYLLRTSSSYEYRYGFYNLLIREDVSYNWTSYVARDPIPPHAAVVGRDPNNNDFFMVRNPAVYYSASTDHFWSYYIRGAEFAWFYHDWEVATFTEMEILQIYD